jgi:hypothetical protein
VKKQLKQQQKQLRYLVLVSQLVSCWDCFMINWLVGLVVSPMDLLYQFHQNLFHNQLIVVA